MSFNLFLMSTPHYQIREITKNDTDISSIVLEVFVAPAMNVKLICNKTTGLYYIAMFLYVISDFLVVCYI